MISTDYDKSLKDAMLAIDHITNMGSQMRMEIQETMDKFIFNTIDPFIKNITTMEISKEELIRAIQLIRMQRESIEKCGVRISNEWNTAIAQSMALAESYKRGYADGKKETYDDIQAQWELFSERLKEVQNEQENL